MSGMTAVDDFFIYALPVYSGLAAGATLSNQVTIQADSDFVLEQVSYHANVANAAFTVSSAPVPNVSLLLTDSGSGRQIMSAPVPLAHFASAPGQSPPFSLRCPKSFVARSTITVALTSFEASTAYNIYLSLIGRKTFSVAT